MDQKKLRPKTRRGSETVEMPFYLTFLEDIFTLKQLRRLHNVGILMQLASNVIQFQAETHRDGAFHASLREVDCRTHFCRIAAGQGIRHCT